MAALSARCKKKAACLGRYAGRLKDSLQTQPTDGRANLALIAWIAKSLDTPKKNIEIVKGESTRIKKIRIWHLDLNHAKECLLSQIKSSDSICRFVSF